MGQDRARMRHHGDVCVRVRRDYRLELLRPETAAGFAGAALLNALTPLDWQISQDAEAAVASSVENLRAALDGGDPSTATWVEVTVHAAHVEFVVGADDPQWVTERVRLRPRRPFDSPVACDLPDPRPAPLPRPVLWPALARPRSESSWAETYEALGGVTQSIRAGVTDLVATLQAVAAGVVRATPFTVAAVNLLREDGAYEVVAVEGPESVLGLLGVVEPPESWAAMIGAAAAWGTLGYIAPDAAPPEAAHMATWVPPIEVSDDAGAWHPLDLLFAELTASDGRRLGVLNVDLPADGRRPDADALERLELFADHAATAIERARTGAVH
jgi:hypothetical protein